MMDSQRFQVHRFTRRTAHKKNRRRFASLLQVFVLLFSMAISTLMLEGTAHAANHTIGQIAGGTGIFSDANTIAFGKTFTAAPVVVVNACDSLGNPIAAAATSVTTTGFTVKLCDLDLNAVKTGNPTPIATVQWVAIIPDENASVQAGTCYLQDGLPVNFSRPFANTYTYVLCSSYNNSLGRPNLTAASVVTTSGFTAEMFDLDGPEDGTLSWIAINITSSTWDDNLYDEVVIDAYMQLYNNGSHIYTTAVFHSYAPDADVILTSGKKSTSRYEPYSTYARNKSLTGFDLSALSNNGTSGTNVWTTWAAFGFKTPGSHIVTYEINGGTTYPNIRFSYTDSSGHAALPTTNPTRTGCHFAEWNTQSDGHGATFTAATVVSEDLTAYAIWTPDSCNVTFDKNGGDTDANPATKTVTSPATTVGTLPANPSRAGYHFTGWNTKADGTGYAFTASTILTATPTTVYAMWAPDTYTVTFDKNGGNTDASPTTKTVTSPATTVGTLPANPSRTGYHFMGWNTQANGGGSAFNASTPVTQSIIVYAMWEPDTYTVTFNKNGGTTDASPATQAVTTPATTITALPTPPGRSGYHFMGWNTQANGSGSAFNASTPVTQSITVYAIWEPDTYTVTFDKNGGNTDAIPTTKTVTSPATIIGSLPSNPSRAGYLFAGWNTGADGSGSAFSASTTVTQSVTVYAMWVPAYTVTFDKNGGDTEANPGTATTDIGGHAVLPAAPVRAGYEFTGWNTKSDGSGAGFTASSVASSNLTVYAQWRLANCTVYFDPQNGSGVFELATCYGSAVAAPTQPIRYGYNFAGWYNGSGAQVSFPYTVTQDITFYARWSQQAATNYLRGVNLSSGRLNRAFSKSVTSYGITIGENDGSFTLTPQKEYDGAAMTINGKTLSCGTIALANGKSTKITVKVTYAKKSKTYSFTVTRAKSTNNSLASLAASAGTWSQPFDPSILNYTLTIEENTKSTTIKAVTSAGKLASVSPASTKVTLNNGAFKNVKITVKAQSGAKRVYTVRVQRAASTNAALKSLKASGLVPRFSSGVTDYAITLPANKSFVSITAAASGYKAKVTVDGGRASKKVTLANGQSVVVRVVVTSQAGNTQEYRITVTRAPLPVK